MLIAGEWCDAGSGETFESLNPFTGKAWAEVPRASEADVDRAVQAARSAFESPGWRELNATERGKLLVRLGDFVAEKAADLAELETRDNGKLINEMSAQLHYMPEWFRYFGGLADKVEGRVIPIDRPGMFNYTLEEPLGVVAALTPWNSPLMLGASGSPRSTRRSPRSTSASCSSRPASRPASSTSSPDSAARSAKPWSGTRR